MKQTFYVIKNNSASEGTYLIDGEYKSLFPGEEVTLKRAPTNKTENLSVVLYRQEIRDTMKVLHKKSKKN